MAIFVFHTIVSQFVYLFVHFRQQAKTHTLKTQKTQFIHVTIKNQMNKIKQS